MSSNKKLATSNIPSIVCGLVLGLVSFTGCSEQIVKTAEPVQVKVKATSSGKQLNEVTLTLQPLAAGGQQADIKLSKGEGEGAVVPGTYTYYVEKGKNMTEVEKIPEAFRRGAMDRKIEISSATTFEVKLD